MKVSTIVFFSIFLILGLFGTTTYINYKLSGIVKENSQYFINSTEIIRQANRFHRNILYMQTSLRGYAVAHESFFVQTYDSAKVENEMIQRELNDLFSHNQRQLQNLLEINKVYSKWLVEHADTLLATYKKLALKSNSSSSLIKPKRNNQSLLQEEQTNNLLRVKFRELANVEYRTRQQKRLLLEEEVGRTETISLVLTISSFVIGLLLAIVLARYVSRYVLRIASIAENIANGNYEVAAEIKSNNEFSEVIASLNKMAKTLQKNFSLLEGKNKELDQFAYVVAHDLKAPLRGVDTLLSWILEGHRQEVSDKVLEYLQLIKERVNKSEELIQAILNYARVGKEKQIKENLDVGILIKNIINNLQIKPEIHIDVQKDLPNILSQKVPLTHVLTNLISNAIKYNDKQLGFVEIGCVDKGKSLQFFVKDNGPGIPKTEHDKIFEIFQTVHSTNTSESTGVGLAIVKKILNERNEQIWIESEVGKGTTFYFTWLKEDPNL